MMGNAFSAEELLWRWLLPEHSSICSLLCTLAVALLALGVGHFYVFRVRRLPPGPFPLPLLGNFLQIDLESPHRSFVGWQKRYGPIYTVWLPKPIIVVADHREMVKLFRKNGPFNDRPMSFLYLMFAGPEKKRAGEGDGIILSRGSHWRSEREKAETFLKAVGPERIEAIVKRHTALLVERLGAKADGEENNGGGVVEDLHMQFALCLANVIQELVLGRFHDYNDPEFRHLKTLIDRMIKNVSGVQMLVVDNFPVFRFLFPTYWRYLADGKALQQFFLDEVEKHIEMRRLKMVNDSANEDEEMPRDFIDFCLEKEADLEQLSFSSKVTLALDAGDLWAGGLETVVATLLWAVIYMIRQPELQNRLRRELVEGLHGEPFTIEGGKRIPYFVGFIKELQRIVNVLPWNLPHALSEEVSLCGKRIPAGTGAMPQIGAVHFNDAIYPEPYEFRPERFIRENTGNKENDPIVQPSVRIGGNHCPFSVGGRTCPGQPIATKELPILLHALVTNFKFEAIDPAKPPSLRRQTGMTAHPREHFACRITRVTSNND